MHCFKKNRRIPALLFGLVLALFLGPLQLSAQNIQVSGIVRDRNNAPVEGASVIVKGTKNGVVTGADGRYTISVPASGVLVISSVNMVGQEIPINGKPELNVTLDIGANQMNEVVVIGYGSRQRKDVTGAVSTVSAKDIEKSTALTPELALQGRMPGVFVGTGSGAPGARPVVRIRGVNTFGYAEPLYVIDGVPFFEGGSGVDGGAIGDIRSPVNALSMINPGDIESVTVLKDASAAAIYGVRASNGVILITTKRGKSGRPKVEVSSLYGIQNIPKTIATLNTQQYFELLREAYAANPEPNRTFAQRFGPRYDQSSPLYQGNAATYNWQDALINKNASISDHSVRLSGGNESATYYLSAGYSNQESPLKANEISRYTIASNVEARVSKVISTGLTIRLVQQKTIDNTSTDLGPMIATQPFQPIFDPRDPTGYAPATVAQFVRNPDYDPSKLDPGAPFNFAPGFPQLLWGPATRFNPFAWQQMNSTTFDLKRVIGTAYVQLEPLRGLRIRGTFGGDYFTNLRRQFADFEAYRFSQTPGNPYTNTNGTAQGAYGERTGTTVNINKELTVNFNRTFFSDHNIDVVLAASDQLNRWSYTDVSNGNLQYRNPRLWGVANERGLVSGAQGVLQEDILLGYMGRISYRYKSKYYLDGTLRRDGSSRLAPGFRWDNFPSFAAAWRISAEKFFPKIDFVNDVKLRGGWGRLGNFQSAQPYQFLSNVSLTPDYSLGSGNGNAVGTQLQGAVLPNFANLNLTWEKLRTTNFGIDATFFNSQFTFTAEYYNKTTFDIIQNVQPPPNTGIQALVSLNIATVRNKGFEFNLGYNGNVGPVNFNVNGNLTTVNNRVLSMAQGNPIGGNTFRVQEGLPIGYLWGFKFGGIFQSQAEIDAWRRQFADESIGQSLINPATGAVYRPGDAYFLDVAGNPRPGVKEIVRPTPDSIVNLNDRTYLGKTIPGYFYGFSFDANYAGFDIAVFFQGIGDVQRYNDLRASGEGSPGGLANQWASAFNRWTPSNPSTTIPRAAWNNPTNPTRFSSRFVENAGFLRLRNLEVGYRLPASILGKTGFIQGLRIFGRGVNVFTLTKWTGIDPENDFVPPTRQFLIGANATF